VSREAKEDDSITGRLGCWISPCYGPFSLGGDFEIYEPFISLTLSLLISYIYEAPFKARNVNVVYIWTYVWQR
jgi:hypothetical protein